LFAEEYARSVFALRKAIFRRVESDAFFFFERCLQSQLKFDTGMSFFCGVAFFQLCNWIGFGGEGTQRFPRNGPNAIERVVIFVCMAAQTISHEKGANLGWNLVPKLSHFCQWQSGGGRTS
jgi:hypothetical protein